APTIDRERALDKSIAKCCRRFGLGVPASPSVIAENPKLLAIQLPEPALDRKLPVGMATEKPADDPDADRLARLRRPGRLNRRIALGHDSAHERAVKRLQVAIVEALIGEIKWLARPYRLCKI